MAKTFIWKVAKVTYSPNAPFMVRIPPGLWQLEGQKKRFFAQEIRSEGVQGSPQAVGHRARRVGRGCRYQ